MLPVAHGEFQFQEVQQSAVQWPASLKQCAALCNSLSLVSKGVMVGDAADLAAFKACEATFLVRLATHCMQGHLSREACCKLHARQCMHRAVKAYTCAQARSACTANVHCMHGKCALHARQNAQCMQALHMRSSTQCMHSKCALHATRSNSPCNANVQCMQGKRTLHMRCTRQPFWWHLLACGPSAFLLVKRHDACQMSKP